MYSPKVNRKHECYCANIISEPTRQQSNLSIIIGTFYGKDRIIETVEILNEIQFKGALPLSGRGIASAKSHFTSNAMTTFKLALTTIEELMAGFELSIRTKRNQILY